MLPLSPDATMPGLVLIGPIGAGKSTLGALLAARLEVTQVSMDRVRFEYYKEMGYDEPHAKTLVARDGFEALYAYWKPFEAYAVERLLADRAHERRVIDFGAGHSVYEDDALFGRVRRALAPYRVVLLLPSPDDDESLRILTERRDKADPNEKGQPAGINEHFVRHPSNRRLADLVVYTGGQTPDESADEVLRQLRVPAPPAATA